MYENKMYENQMKKISLAAEMVGGVRSLARLLEISEQVIHRWKAGRARISAEKAIKIEKVTKKFVTRQELRPDIEWD